MDVATKFLLSLPTHELHEKSQPTGIESGPVERKRYIPSFQRKLTDPNEVRRALREFVKNECSASKPSPTNQAYYPTTADIRNHMYKAKIAIQLSKFDQKNLALKIEEWKRLNSDE